MLVHVFKKKALGKSHCNTAVRVALRQQIHCDKHALEPVS